MYTNKIIKLDVREKTMEYGVSFPLDEELIMLILGSGTKDLPVNQMAHKIVEVLDASGGKDVVPHLMQKGAGNCGGAGTWAAAEYASQDSGDYSKGYFALCAKLCHK